MKIAAFAAVAVFATAAANAQVTVDKPWVRSTVAQQTTTAAYLTITSARGGKLVSASSPVAAAVDVHEMKMDGDLMKMRAVDAVPLPAGQPVEFKPNGLHVMLTGLKAPLKAGDVVPIKLVVEDAKGKRETVDVKAVARQN
ncbi:copper chaperone PCu(A)C [Scleromatobacter humisilvae]|uniref:Copper chaperone PCu(A)C n=1 Tax=Scleromatobacter humisilvae TaxID=2897159 RepID=A0A9X2C106_9BURK|nr:copper chaperone PCu(A)C [Scleromatobacter humisilvae]MCK9687752.1 copper chaperone PCu(A)C [Scleromatobacter humisilvae]